MQTQATYSNSPVHSAAKMATHAESTDAETVTSGTRTVSRREVGKRIPKYILKKSYDKFYALLGERDIKPDEVKEFLQATEYQDRRLFENEFSPSIWPQTYLFKKAITSNHHRAIASEIDYFKENSDHFNVLYYAYKCLDADMVRALLDFGVNPMSPDYQQLWSMVITNISYIGDQLVYPYSHPDNVSRLISKMPEFIINLIEATVRLDGGIEFLRHQLDATAHPGGRIEYHQNQESPTWKGFNCCSVNKEFDGKNLEKPTKIQDLLLGLSCRQGTVGMFKIMLDFGATESLTFLENTGLNYTPHRLLTVAIEHEHEESVSYLIENYPALLLINCRTRDNPVYLAASINNSRLFGVMIEFMKKQLGEECARKILPAVLNLQDENGYSLLYKAAQNGNTDLTRALISAGANPVRDVDSASSWAKAMANGHREISQILTQSILDILGQADSQDYLEQLSKKVNKFNLFKTVGQGDIKSLMQLIIEQVGVDPDQLNSEGKTPLDIALDNDDHEMIETLVQMGASRQGCNGETLLHELAKSGSPELFQLAINAFKNRNPLFCKNAFRNLLNKPDGQGHPPLYWAIKGDRFDIILTLITNGADPFPDIGEKTVFHCLAKADYRDSSVNPEDLFNKLANALTDNEPGAPKLQDYLNKVDEHGNRPLRYAIENGHCELVEEMVAKGSDLQVDNDGTTVFHLLGELEIARRGNQLKIADALLRGIDKRQVDKRQVDKRQVDKRQVDKRQVDKEYLLSVLNQTDGNGDTALYNAFGLDYIIWLTAKGAVAPNKHGRTLFHQTCERLDKKTFDALVSGIENRYGDDKSKAKAELRKMLNQPDIYGQRPLYYALHESIHFIKRHYAYGHDQLIKDFVEMLKSHGALE